MREAQTDRIRLAVAKAGLRNTAATHSVVAVFLNARAQLLSHAEVDTVLRRKKLSIDKVTLYRLLDRLVTAGLLHKVVEPDRVSRFGWNLDATPAQVVHPRFECRTCHTRYQLADLPDGLRQAIELTMAQWGALGHRGLEAEIAVRGVCAQCVRH